MCNTTEVRGWLEVRKPSRCSLEKGHRGNASALENHKWCALLVSAPRMVRKSARRTRAHRSEGCTSGCRRSGNVPRAHCSMRNCTSTCQLLCPSSQGNRKLLTLPCGVDPPMGNGSSGAATVCRSAVPSTSVVLLSPAAVVIPALVHHMSCTAGTCVEGLARSASALSTSNHEDRFRPCIDHSWVAVAPLVQRSP